jgi:hypothetical protein
MNKMDMMSPEKVAAEYGGDKKRIGQAAQMGLLNPTVAVMAGMFIDRMRQAAASEQGSPTTVAQDVMVPPAPPQGMAPQGMPTAAPVERGLAALPVDESMIPGGEEGYAGGGIVAFDEGGPTTPFGRSALGRFTSSIGDYFSDQEELARLRSELKAKYERRAAILPGAFMEQPEGGMAEAQNMLGNIYKMDLNQLRQFAANEKPGRDLSRDFKDVDTGVDLAGINIPKPAKSDVAKEGSAKAPATVNVKKAEKAVESYADKVRALNKEFGVSGEPDAKAREALDKYREKLAKDLDKAGALGLIQAGLGIAGGKSQYALQNLAGASPAITEYSRAASQIRGEEKGIVDSEAKLDQAADARARGNVKLALELEKDAKEMALRERQVSATERQANKPSAFSEMMAAYRADPQGFESYRRTLTGADESTQQRINAKAIDVFSNAKMMGFSDRAYADLQKAAKGGDAKAVQALREYENAKYEEILARLGGSSGVPGGGKTLNWADL